MGTSYQKLRLAAVQAAPVFLDRQASIEKARRLIREAGDNGADFIGFPENFIPGYPLWYFYHPAVSKKSYDFAVELFKNSMEIPGPEVDALCEAAAAANAFVVMGITERRADTSGTLYNTQLFIDRRGEVLGKHQKLVPTVTERLVHTGGAGDTQGVMMTEYGPVSGLVCGENSNPMAVALLAAQYTRIHVACWPNHFVPAGKFSEGYLPMPEASLIAARNMAYMCKCYVVSPCGVVSTEMRDLLATTEQDRAFMSDPKQTGGTTIIDPMANVIAGPMPGSEEGIAYADADLEHTVRMRMIHDFGGHYNRPDVFRLLVNSANPGLIGNMSGQDTAALPGPVPRPAADTPPPLALGSNRAPAPKRKAARAKSKRRSSARRS
ncbi:MAG: carbon-nitrogen hydrolase family protein [Candidatus Binatia bacterium]